MTAPNRALALAMVLAASTGCRSACVLDPAQVESAGSMPLEEKLIVLRADGQGLVNACVTLRILEAKDGTVIELPWRTTRTDDRGLLLLVDVPQGIIGVTLTVPGFARETIFRTELEIPGPFTRDIRLEPAGWMRGRVVVPSGSSLDGCRVRAYGRMGDRGEVWDAVIDVDGGFAFDNVPRSHFFLALVGPGCHSQMTCEKAGELPLELRPGVAVEYSIPK